MIGYIDATDEMFGIIFGVLSSSTVHDLLSYDMDIRWPGKPVATKPDPTKLWARVSKQIVTDSQSSLANDGQQREFDATGLLYVQLFCPKNQPASLENGRTVAVALQQAFRKQSPSDEIWFRNQAIRELPETDENYPINVITEFQYTSLDPV